MVLMQILVLTEFESIRQLPYFVEGEMDWNQIKLILSAF